MSSRAVSGELGLDRPVDIAVDTTRAKSIEDPFPLEHGGDGGLEAGEAQRDLHAFAEVEDLGELRSPLRIDEVHALEI